MKIFRNMVAVIAVIALNVSLSAQETCVTNSRNPWEWPGHNNWFIGTFSGANNVTGLMIDFQAGFSVSTTGQNAFDKGTPVYEGVTTASDDNGNLIMFSNGRWAWDANSTRTSTGIKEGNEGGTNIVGSASQGIICVRHPLAPFKWYILTVGDVIGGANPPLSYNIFDENGQETQAATSLGVNATEGIAATWHENEVDIWVSVLGYNSTTLYSFLLTCDGFVDPPVTSNVGNNQTGDGGRGGNAFSHDGRTFAAAYPNGWPNSAKQLVLYDFDRKTGKFSNPRDMAPTNVVIGPYDVCFSKDDSKVLLTGGNAGGVHVIDVNSGAYTKESSIPGHHAVEIGADGNYYFNGKDGLWRWSGAGSFSKVNNSTGQGLPTMFIPPAEEPDIQEVGPYCDTSQIIDLHTYWVCSGLSAEDTLKERHLYTGNGIVDDKKGHFNPMVAGVGTHEIVFEYCDVNDTIWIEVTPCFTCKADVQDITPEICPANTILLDTMELQSNGPGVWTIEPAPSGNDPVISTSGSDTLFDASLLATNPGTYKLKFEVTSDGETCYDTMFVIVNPLPNVDLGPDQEICFGDDPVTFDAGAGFDYAWLPDGETTQTIEKDIEAEYIVEITDAKGCRDTDSVYLTVHALPTVDLGNDTAICEGDDPITFDAGAGFDYAWLPDGETTQTIDKDIEAEYIAEITDANGCKDTDSVYLTVHARPVADLGADQEICSGDDPVTFDASAGFDYAWLPDGETTQTISKDIEAEYIAEITDGNGCKDTDSVYLTVHALPVADLGNDTAICVGQSAVTFDAGAGFTYAWLPDGETTQTIDKDIEAEYIAEITDVNGCKDTDSVYLQVNLFTVVNIGNDVEICDGDSAVTFDANILGATYTWAPNGETTQTITTDVAGEYSVAIVDSNGCPGYDTINLGVNPRPVADLGADQEICFGDAAVTFDAGAGFDYAWLPDGETTQTIDKDIEGEFIAEITDAKGCKDTDSVYLTVNALPVVDLGVDLEICEVEPAETIDAGNPGATYLWSTGESTATIDIHDDSDFDVLVTDTNGCEGRDTLHLTVHAMPTVAMPDQVICYGDAAVTFDAGAGFDTYVWSSGESTQSISTDTDGEYRVTFTDAQGCSGEDTVMLTVNPLPTPDLGADRTICADAAAETFDAGPYASYSWSSGESSQTMSTATAGVYTLEVTDANGCKGSDDVELIVIELPNPDVILDVTKCPGSNATLDASVYDNGNGPFTYAWHDGSTGSSYTTGSPENTWVDITDSYGCVGRDLAVVSDKANLDVLIVGAPTIDICEGEDVDLIPNYKAVDGYNFSWTGGMTSTNEVINVSQSGTYDLHVDNGGGCEGDGTIDVVVHPNPVLTPNPAAICDGAAATIGDNLGGTYTYKWSTGETTAEISVTTANTYNVEVTSNMGCVSDMDVTVTVNSNPTPDLGNDINVCTGVPVNLSDKNAQPGQTESWSTGETTAEITPTTDGTYTVTVTSAAGCVGTDAVEVSFIPIPTVDLGPDINLCEGESATVDAGNVGLDISWNTGQTTSSFTVSQTATHIVTISDNGCTATDEINVNVVPLPESQIDHSLSQQKYCFEEMDRGIDLTAGTDPAYDYLWGTGETTGEITIEGPGTFNVMISVGDCYIEDRIKIEEFCPSFLYIPNTFTPDGDGKNDYFNARGHNITDYHMYIYNRWGEMIYESTSMTNDWDGTYKGNPVQIDTYVYKVYYSVNHPDGNPRPEQKVGHVNVLR